MATNPNVITTTFPDPAQRHAPLVPGSEQLLIDAAIAELGILQRIGDTALVVPGVRYEITTATSANPEITVRTQTIEGEEFPPGWEWPGMGLDAPHQAKAAELAGHLINYYEHVLSDQPELFLGGIAHAHGWAVTPAGQLALKNTAPLMIAGRGPTLRNNVAAQYSTVYDWVRNLQPHYNFDHQMVKARVWGILDALQ